MPSQKEVMEGFARLQEMALSILDEEDPERIMEIGEQIKEEAQAFEALAMAYEAEMGQTARTPGARFEVVLTDAQKQRVKSETGVSMETIFIQDTSGVLNANMVTTHPHVIEMEALRQAREMQSVEPAKEEARRVAEESLDIIESQGDAFAEQVRALKEDPRFQEIMNFDKKKK
jgi:hypothetical protein